MEDVEGIVDILAVVRVRRLGSASFLEMARLAAFRACVGAGMTIGLQVTRSLAKCAAWIRISGRIGAVGFSRSSIVFGVFL